MKYIPYSGLGNFNVLKNDARGVVTVYSDIFIYGSCASEKLAKNISADVRIAWNRPRAKVLIIGKSFRVEFKIRCYYTTSPMNWIANNRDYKKIFMRVETMTDKPSNGEISYMDAIRSNSGVFLIKNIIASNSTTEAHEIGHGWGLIHEGGGPGQPGIMWARGTRVDAAYRYDPTNSKSTINPDKRLVLITDVLKLRLDHLKYDSKGRAYLGKLTNVYHSYK